jgi:hypothetical protein
MAVVRIARAEPGGAPTPVDAARQNEKYVILPGAEPLFSDMLGSGQALPGGCTFSNGQIGRTSVLATYTCGGGHVVLQLLHPEIALPGGVRTQRFAITVKSGAPPAGLVETIADRIRAREAAFEWTVAPAFERRSQRSLGGGGTQTMRWAVPVAAGAAVTILVFWALRRLAARRGWPD